MISTELVKLTILGRVPAGLMRDCWPDAEEVELPADQLPANMAGFVGLRVSGDSMTGAGIHDGDIVLVRRSEVVESGQIAVVIIDGEITLKRVIFDGGILLRAENPGVPDVRVQGLTVFGVLVGKLDLHVAPERCY